MILTEKFTEVLERLYGKDTDVLTMQLVRYNNLFKNYSSYFTDTNVYLFSTPGRTELGGNHTDHNMGRVIAASINLDSIAVVSMNDENKITLFSDGFDKQFEVDLSSLKKVKTEVGTTTSLIRGIASRFKELGFNIGGFNCVMTSDVKPGSGLSSSASIEVLIGSIFNSLFNNDKISNEQLAIIGQYAENNYFEKPCGLMDQMACAVGGIIAIDFQNPENPKVEKIDFNFEAKDYRLLIVETGGNHADLTEDYAAIPAEMKEVAKALNKEVCREIDKITFFKNLKEIRQKVGDRSTLRAMHFINENERVQKQITALKNKNFDEFLKLVQESGNSSIKLLQNIYSTKKVNEQSLSLALALSEQYIRDNDNGACRVHGGGFAGTIQVFLPTSQVSDYKQLMSSVFGESSVQVLSIRNEGSICLNEVK